MDSNSAQTFDLMKSDERAAALSKETSVFLNVAKFEQMQRVATMLAKSDFIPDRFRNHVGNCMVALDMASLMGMHPVMLMRTMYVVHGQPGFEGKFITALINNSGRYVDPLEYEWRGKQGDMNWGCRAYAVRKSTGKTVYGPWVDWKMVVEEGWNKPKGNQKSKWSTMPEIMFAYRAGSYFGNKNDSDLLMGMRSIDELEEMEAELKRQPDGSYAMPGTTRNIKPSADLYAADSKAPENATNSVADATNRVANPETENQKSNFQKDEGVKTEDAPAVETDDFGTPKDSPFEKSQWFAMKAGKFENGSGFAAYVQRFADELPNVSAMTYATMCEKYSKLYEGKTMPWKKDGKINPITDSDTVNGGTDTEGQASQENTTQAGQAPPKQDEIDPPQEDLSPDEKTEDLFDSNAAKLLAEMAKKHKREYMMVVKNRVPESTEQIFEWMNEINELVVKHNQEPPPDYETF